MSKKKSKTKTAPPVKLTLTTQDLLDLDAAVQAVEDAHDDVIYAEAKGDALRLRIMKRLKISPRRYTPLRNDDGVWTIGELPPLRE